MTSVRTLLLELVDERGASHIRELHIEILRDRPNTPEHTIRARLSEAVDDGLLNRLGDGFYDVYAEDEGMTSVVSYPERCPLWGDSRFRGNCDGRLFKNLILRYRAKRVADGMMGSGTTRDVIAGLNRYKRAGIEYWGGDLREGFDLTQQALPARFDFVWLHPLRHEVAYCLRAVMRNRPASVRPMFPGCPASPVTMRSEAQPKRPRAPTAEWKPQARERPMTMNTLNPR